MKEFRSKLLSNSHPASLKKLEEVMIPPDGVKYKLKKVIDGTPPDKGLENISGELTNEEWDDMENEQKENNLAKKGSGNTNVVDDVLEYENEVETEAGRGQADAAASLPVQEKETASLDPKIRTDLECLSRTEWVVGTEKKQGSVELLSFLVKVENALANERQRCKPRAQAKKSKANMTNGNDIVDELLIIKTNLTFLTSDIFAYYTPPSL